MKKTKFKDPLSYTRKELDAHKKSLAQYCRTRFGWSKKRAKECVERWEKAMLETTKDEFKDFDCD